MFVGAQSWCLIKFQVSSTSSAKRSANSDENNAAKHVENGKLGNK